MSQVLIFQDFWVQPFLQLTKELTIPDDKERGSVARDWIITRDS